MCLFSCTDKSIQAHRVIESKFLKNLNERKLDLLTFELLERNSVDSLRIVYEYRIEKGNKKYYYNLAATYLELNDNKGIEILKKGASFKDNGCLLALAMYYENGQFALIKGNYTITTNLDSAICYYTIAANNNDMQSQANLSIMYFELPKIQNLDSCKKYLKMCIENNSDYDEGDIKGAAIEFKNRNNIIW